MDIIIRFMFVVVAATWRQDLKRNWLCPRFLFLQKNLTPDSHRYAGFVDHFGLPNSSSIRLKPGGVALIG